MAAKAKQTTEEAPGDLMSAMLNWFRDSRMGREAQRAVQEMEEHQTNRAAAFDQWLAAEARRAELAALEERRNAVKAELIAAMQEIRPRLFAAGQAYDALAQHIAHQQASAEIVIRQTAAPLLHDYGPVRRALDRAREHVIRHGGIELEREYLEAIRRDGVHSPTELKEAEQIQRRVDLADEAEAISDAIRKAIGALSNAQFERHPDVQQVLARVFANVPHSCPCGHHFDFPGASDAEGAA